MATDHDPAPTATDLGSLFPVVAQLADANRYRLSFLGDRFSDLDSFKTAAREKLLELLLYRPAETAPEPELVERTDCGDYLREKVLFSTAPEFRVPAYAKAGIIDRFSGCFYDVAHRFTMPMQDDAFDWFDRQLKRPA